MTYCSLQQKLTAFLNCINVKFSFLLNYIFTYFWNQWSCSSYFININVYKWNENCFKVILDYNWLSFIKIIRKWLLLTNKIQLISTIQKVTIKNLCSGWTDFMININKQTEQQRPQKSSFLSHMPSLPPDLHVLLREVWEKQWHSLLAFKSVLLPHTVQYLEQID